MSFNIFSLRIFSRLVVLALFVCQQLPSRAQNSCPPNIDFESGNFSNWEILEGTVGVASLANQIKLSVGGPTAGRHDIISKTSNGNALDRYGLFPQVSPNGSNYSIKLGNNIGGQFAEGISYRFVVPAGQNQYSLLYWYAVVFQNPNHQEYQQPRFTANVFDETTNTYIVCSSFTFVGSSGLPGFEKSPVINEVIYKKWTPVTVNLSGLAGHAIRLEFITADCTEGGHFGYAYIDISSQCNQPIQGAIYCQDAKEITLTAPFAYESYRWSTANFSQSLGNSQILTLTLPPADNTLFAVELFPYAGFGCIDTIYTSVKPVIPPPVFAGNDTSICSGSFATLGRKETTAGLYSWSPAENLTNASGNYTLVKPATSTSYILTASDSSGGCVVSDTVRVNILPSPQADFTTTKACVSVDLNILNNTNYSGANVLKYRWDFGDGNYSDQKMPKYAFTKTGAYQIHLTVTSLQCPSDSSVVTKSVIVEAPPAEKRIKFSTIVNQPTTISTVNKGINYLWNPPSGLNRDDLAEVIFTGQTNQKFLVAIRNDAGCTVTDTVDVTVSKAAGILVPDAFTPNKDGMNDLVFPFLVGIKDLKYFRIWNRWGQLVYESKTDRPGWDGRFNNMDQPVDAYVWEAIGVTQANQPIKAKGLVHLLR